MNHCVIIDGWVYLCATYEEALEVAATNGGEIC